MSFGFSCLTRNSGAWRPLAWRATSFSASRTDTDLDDALVAMTGDLTFFGPNPGSASATFGTTDVRAIDDTLSLGWQKGGLNVQLSHTATSAEKSDFSNAAVCRAGDSAVLCDSEYSYATTALKVEQDMLQNYIPCF